MKAGRPAFATTLVHALGDPNSPVCRQDEVKLFLGYGVHPTAHGTSARKRESVFAVAVDNGKLNIAVERSGLYWLPVHNEFIKKDMADSTCSRSTSHNADFSTKPPDVQRKTQIRSDAP
jgi:hypothetical protein